MLGLVRLWIRSLERVACEIRDGGQAVVCGHPECYLIVLPIAEGGGARRSLVHGRAAFCNHRAAAALGGAALA
jgi:hypothetical protein